MKFHQNTTGTKPQWVITLEEMGYTVIRYHHNTHCSDDYTYISNGVDAIFYMTVKGRGFFEQHKNIPQAQKCTLVTPDANGLVELPEMGAHVTIDPLAVDPSRMYLDNGQRNYDRQHFIDETNVQVITATLPIDSTHHTEAHMSTQNTQTQTHDELIERAQRAGDALNAEIQRKQAYILELCDTGNPDGVTIEQIDAEYDPRIAELNRAYGDAMRAVAIFNGYRDEFLDDA